MPENGRPYRPRDETHKKCREGKECCHKRVGCGEKLSRKHRGRSDAVKQEVVPLDTCRECRGPHDADIMSPLLRALARCSPIFNRNGCVAHVSCLNDTFT